MGGLNVDPRITELHSIMPMANIGSMMTHDSQRQHLTGAKRAISPTAWVRAVDVIIAPMIDNIGRLSVQSRTRVVFRDTLLPKLNSGELRVEHAEDLIEESP